MSQHHKQHDFNKLLFFSHTPYPSITFDVVEQNATLCASMWLLDAQAMQASKDKPKETQHSAADIIDDHTVQSKFVDNH